jgi:hypothetical protein
VKVARPAVSRRLSASAIRNRLLHSVDQRVAKIENTLQELANVLVLTARQDEPLIAIMRHVDRLEQASTINCPQSGMLPIGSSRIVTLRSCLSDSRNSSMP